MAHIAVTVAKQVVTEINAHTFTTAITAVRKYLPEFDLKDMATLHCTVVPKSMETVTANRAAEQDDIAIDVVLQKLADPADLAAVDALASLAQEVADFFARHTLTDGSASWVRTEQVIYSQDHMSEKRLFTNLLTFTFRTVR